MNFFQQICKFMLCIWVILEVAIAQQPKRPNFNPLIIQDSRDLPQVDGTFGFLYRTEDGIAHGAVGDTNGAVQGRFTYTDPSGIKVNYNYNAGSRKAPSDYLSNPKPSPPRPREPAPIEEPAEEPVYDYYDPPQPRPQKIAPARRPAKQQNKLYYGSYSY